MKLKKIFAGTVAGALAVSALAASVSAGGHLWTLPEGTEKDDGLILNNGMYLIQLFNVGNPAENKPAVDYGVNVNDVDGFKAYVQVMDSEDASAEDFDFSMGDGGFGGGFIYSANGDQLGDKKESDVYDEATGKTYYDTFNWQGGLTWWGLPAEDDSPDKPIEEKQGTVDYEQQYTYAEYIDKLHYKISCTLPESIVKWPSMDERKGGCYQIGMQEWSPDNFHLLKINLFIVLDANGEPIIAFDEVGTPIQDAAEIKKMMDELDKPQQTEAPANTEGDTSSNAPEESGAAASTDAPATTTAAATSAAPTTTAAQSSSNSGSNNTGLIIGIIAVVAVVVVVVVVIVIKKKKS